MTPAERLLAAAFVALGLALPLSVAVSNMALGLLSVGLLAAAATSQRAETAGRLKSAVSSPLFLALALYAAASLISGLGGADVRYSLSIWPKDLQKLWVVVAVGAALNADRRRLFARALAAGAAAAALIGVAQSLGSALARGPYLRAHAFMHPVSYGESLGLVLLGLLSWDDETLPRPWRRAALALIVPALALNQTRAVLAGVVAGAVVMALVEPRRRRLLLPVLLAAAAAAGAWEWLAGPRSIHALLEARAGSPQEARFTLWRVAAGMFRDRPLFGAGPGNFRLLYPRYFSGVLDGERTVGSAHDLFLHQAAERGLVGLLGLGAVLLALAADLRRRLRERRDAWTLWALSACAAFLVMNMTEIAFQTEQVATLFLIVVLL